MAKLGQIVVAVLLVAFASSFGVSAIAGPWLPPGDTALRHDILLLSDAGVIKGPTTSWPLAWADIGKDIVNFEDQGLLNSAEADAYARLAVRVRHEMRTGQVLINGRVAGASNPVNLRTFKATPRENGEIEVGVQWTGNRFAFQLKGQAVSNAQDNKSYRVDDSYLAFVWGNMMFSVDTQDRWWGPAWEGSTILSNNARPVPSIVWQRNLSTPFKSKWLSWIGPWSAIWIWGQMEDNRAVSNARLWGLRITAKPLEDLEIGLSRTAQWCGSGRPCDFDTFVDLLKGTEDNRGSGVNLDDEPGNQLAALDFRWSSPFSDWPFAIYGQATAEDEAGGAPSRWIGQGGIEFWGSSPFEWLPGSYRVHIEAADTAAEWYDDPIRFDYAYEHFIYTDGYRYRDRSIGHSMDNDGQMYSLGLILNSTGNSTWEGLLRRVYLNRGGTLANPVSPGDDTLWNIELSHGRDMGAGKLDVGLGYDSFDSGGSGQDDDFRFFVQWMFEL